jgi:hypothetical protein
MCLSVLPIDIIRKHTSKLSKCPLWAVYQQVAKEIHGQPVWTYFNTSECPPVEDLEDVALYSVFYVHQCRLPNVHV